MDQEPVAPETNVESMPESPADAVEESTMEGFAQAVTADSVTFMDGLALNVTANQDMTMNDAAAFGVAVGRDLQMTNGGAFGVAVGHDLAMTNGGAFTLTVGSTTEITNGGAGLLMGSTVNAQSSMLGVVLASTVNVEEGSKIMFSTKQAAAFGAALGAVFALLSLLLRRK